MHVHMEPYIFLVRQVITRLCGISKISAKSETWTPMGENAEISLAVPNEDLKTAQIKRMERILDWRFQTLSFYMGNYPRLTTLSPL